GKKSYTHGAPQASDQVHTNYVEGVIETEAVLQPHAQARQDAADCTEDQGGHWGQCASCWSNCDQTGDDTRSSTQGGCVSIAEFFSSQPAKHRSCGCRRGVHPGQARKAVGCERRATVEPEPTKPRKRSAEHDHGQVVRPGNCLAKRLSLADDKGQHKGRCARRNVNNGTTSKVDR